MSGTDVMIECLGWTLLHFLWEGLVIAILLGILLRALRKASANSRYVAGCVALALMVAAPVGTYMQLAKKPVPVSSTVFRMPTESVPMEITPRIISIQPTKVAVTEQKKPAVTLSWSERLTPLLPVLVAGWAMGVVVLALRLSAGWLRVKRLKSLGTESMEEIWHARLAELARRLRINRSVRIVKSALVEVPTVVGWLRPIILMPAGCLAGLSAAQVEYILAHELAHARRHDYLVNLLQCLAETILFYHPAVWWVSRRIREEREHCCDDVAVSVCGNRLEYARTLAALEELRGSQNQLVMAAAGAPLLQRIRRLVGQSERNPSHPVWPLAAIVILVLVATLGIGFRSSRAVADETQGTNLRTNRTTAILKSDSQTHAGASARQSSSASQSQPQINIQAKFIELDEKDFPTSIFNLAGASNAISTSTMPTLPTNSSPVLATVTNSIVQSFTGILSGPDYQKALKAFKAAHSAEILSSPSMVTVGGQRAEMMVGDIIPVLTNNSPTAATFVPTGVKFNISPTLPANGAGLQLATMATVTKLTSTKIPPHMEIAQLSTETILQDGQTLVMGGFMPEVVTKMTDKVPVLGSIPLAGRLFRSESISKSRKYLIVFVTPTLINQDGSRYHSDKKDPVKASSTAVPETLKKQNGLTLAQDENGTLDVFYESGKSNAAEDKLQEALKLLPLPNFTLRTNSGTTSPSSAPDAPQKQNASTLVQDGKLLFESGKSDAAEAKFQEALKLDPNNAQAGYYLNLIKEKRTGQAVRRSELDYIALQKQQLQLPNGYARSNAVYTGRGRQAILSKLDCIRVDSIEYDGMPLAEVIKNLSEIAKTRDPDRTGINFFINHEAPATGTSLAVPGAIDPTTGLPIAGAALPTEPVDVGGVTVKIAPALTDVRLADVLDAITKTSDKPIKYSVEDYAVVFSLKGPETVPLFTRVYHIDPIKFRHGLEAAGAFGKDSTNSQGGGQQGGNGIRNVVATNSYEDIQIATRNLFTAAGVDFNPTNPANVGKALFFNERKGILSVHATQDELESIEKVLGTINTPDDQIELDAPPKQEEEQLPNSIARTNLVKTIKGRKEIIAALNRIRANSADYQGLSLEDAVAKLNQATKLDDPGSSGIAFFIGHETPKDSDLGKIVLKPTREQIDVPLIAVLDSIATNNSLQYATENYGVVFGLPSR